MSHRTFRDARGTECNVWSVYPGGAERRLVVDRRLGPDPGWRGAERRSGPDRRRSAEPRVRVSPGLEAGWLAFECSSERRHLAPPPAGWEAFSDEELARLCERARVVNRRRRLIE